jgi:hypothetical protein
LAKDGYGSLPASSLPSSAHARKIASNARSCLASPGVATGRELVAQESVEGEVRALRKRIVGMLLAGNVPHEFKQYVKLLRTIGIGDLWPAIEKVPRSNPYVMRWYAYQRKHAA